MSSTFYLLRNLWSDNKTYTEAELLTAFNFVIVLAEPGAGKSELMTSLAHQLGTIAVTASKFAYIGAKEESVPLVIDEFDELAKVDDSGIYKLLSQAKAISPTHVYLASRSSEWDNSATNAFKEFFGQQPTIARLCEFDETEQRKIFDHHVKGENFSAFRSEVERFDLEALLPNPQFLKLFADAYIESERRFTDKRSIFSKAVERLAKEVNPFVKRTKPLLSTNKKVSLSSEVFAKLLLSGAEGICISEASENRMYPMLSTLCDASNAEGILTTRLFKPGDTADQHRWVHKIVAEYCAASYLCKRIADPADPLTLSKCLPIIAPNSTVRDELRGLLGWMAALGSQTTQITAIELDAYAVLANGDPSQLEKAAKRLLVSRLKEVEAEDPYFRGGDFWRRFSVAGFFTQEVVEEIKPLLESRSNGHLRDLIFELLIGSPAVEFLRDELRRLVITPSESGHTRILANNCLADVNRENLISDLDELISEGSIVSLRVVAETFQSVGLENFDRPYFSNFFRKCVKLYPGYRSLQERVIGERYFLKKLIVELDLVTVEELLDELSAELVCDCGNEPFECYCRNGLSKIMGSMLDRYFDLASPPFEAKRVWAWIKNLNFHESKDSYQSIAVKVLQDDDDLRQSIIKNVFEGMTDCNLILHTLEHKFGVNSHSGLRFCAKDYRFIVDLAFETDNPILWSNFIERHRYHQNSKDQGPNDLRRHMRNQANKKPSLMREWTIANKAFAQGFKKRLQSWSKYHRSDKRRRTKKETIRTANIKFVNDKRSLVEGGRHWGCLMRFAELVLMEPDKIEQEFGDELLVRTALRNCLVFITPYVPNWLELTELRIASRMKGSETILFAACLEILRAKGNLEDVDKSSLGALRTRIDMGYKAVTTTERDALKAEIDRLLFPNREAVEEFLRQVVEPQLNSKECIHPDLDLLNRDEVFSHLRAELSIEWLDRFKNLDLSALYSLFETAAQYGDRVKLKEIIAKRCREFMSEWPENTDNNEIEQKRTFWLIRAWCFIGNAPEEYWNWLKANKDNVLAFNELFGHMGRGNRSNWPTLTSKKIESILEAYFDKWPYTQLPDSWGSDSPSEEKAYRFLTEVIWKIDGDNPDDAIEVLERLLDQSRFVSLHNDLKSIRASQKRKRALRDFEPPIPEEIVKQLDFNEVVTVEALRELVIQELDDFQKAINGGEFNSSDRFYEKGERLNEIRSTEIIAERLNLKFEPRGVTVTPEHQVKGAKRCDFTVTKMIGGRRRLLVTEVKGQWHDDLYGAASAQLHERYSIHPDAEQQGVYLVIWFGKNEKVAGRKNHGIESSQELKVRIEATLPPAISGLIDVFVLDVSKPRINAI